MSGDFDSFIYEHAYQAVGVCLAANVPVILWGKPGQGKTSVIDHFARKLGRRLEPIIASIREPQDFLGLPALRNESMEYHPPAWAKQLSQEARPGIIFFDEISTAPPSVQAALLRVCLEKVVGDLRLDKGTRVIAAANPAEMAADGWDLALPLANRFCHLKWELPASVVAEGFTKGWPVYDIPDLDEEKLKSAENEEKLIVAGFLRGHQSMVTQIPDATPDEFGAFPTPRSWEMAATLSAAVTTLELSDDLRRLLILGCIGISATNAYLAYRDSKDLPDAEEIIANPDLDIPKRSDVLWVIGSNVIYALREKNTVDRWIQVEKFIIRLFKLKQPDLAYAIHSHWSALASGGQSQSVEMTRLIAPFKKVS